MVLPSRVFVMVTLTLQVSPAEQMAWRSRRWSHRR